MNFSDNERTGLQEERRLALLFTEWGWGTAKYEPDAGFDLTVEPDRALFNSGSFYVQVKGTVKVPKAGRSISAGISKSRLRLYAASEIPVFIVRALPGGTFHWIHAQTWCRANHKALEGAGTLTVRFDPEQRIERKEDFVAVLLPLLTPLARRPDALPFVADQRREYLMALDSRLDVDVEYSKGTTTYIVQASDPSQPVAASFTMRLNDPKDVDAIVRFNDYGFPLDIKASEVSMKGSPIFEAFGTSQPHSSQIWVAPRERDPARIVLYAGPATMDATSIEFDATISGGTKGAGIKTDCGTSYLNIEILMTPGSAGDMQSRFNIGLDLDYVCGQPLASAVKLRSFVTWFDKARAAGAITFGIELERSRAATTVPLADLDSIRPSLEAAYLTAKSHLIARELGSGLVLPRDFGFSGGDVQDIQKIHAILMGKIVPITIEEFHVDGDPKNVESSDVVVCTSTFYANLFDQKVGEIPIIVEMKNFEAHPHGDNTRLVPKGSDSVRIRRNPDPSKDLKMIYESEQGLGETSI